MKTNLIIKTLMLVTIVTLGASFLLLNKNSAKKTSATENKPEIISNLYSIQNVSSTTKVYLDEYTYSLAQVFRKNVFVNKIAQMVDSNLSTPEKFKSKLYEFLKLNVDGTDIADNNTFFHDEAKYYFLRHPDGTYPSNVVRNALAEAFYDWFFEN